MAPRAPTPLARVGRWLARHPRQIQGVQWAVVTFYAALVALPAFADLPPEEAHLYDNLVLFAQFVFWGIWWPFVILSVMVVGRVWCGIFCPEGALSEWASRHGAGRPVPRWLKWGGWPFVAFVATTVYGQMVSVYGYAKPALLILGGSTVAAVAVGLIYGRGHRVWCRHLCPVSGVFGLLARLAPFHFRVDRIAWDAAAATHPKPVACAPLIDIRRMQGAAECHMCGRCAGRDEAVQLARRPFGEEVTRLPVAEARVWEVRLLLFGMLGVALGAFQWSASPWFVALKQRAAEWLVALDSFWLLDDSAPWWLLTHYPQVNDAFTWLDGLLLPAYVAAQALLVGGWAWGWLILAGSRLPGAARANGLRLAYALVPLAGLSLFVGLSLLTTSQLQAEQWAPAWANDARLALLALGVAWSARLLWRSAAVLGATRAQRWGVVAPGAIAMAPVVLLWTVQFRVW